MPAPSSPSSVKDHPRIRGEHTRTGRAASAPAGSSPHTRGAPCHRQVEAEAGRIIPAYAGSTDVTGGDWGVETDHPRIRGEHAPHNGAGVLITLDHPRIRGEHSTPTPETHRPSGSSPHTRGAPHRVASCQAILRIIPAYAGSTASFGRYRVSPSDHPRIRGEHKNLPNFVLATWGSSPHTRGARFRRSWPTSPSGIIPAYAGSTVKLSYL